MKKITNRLCLSALILVGGGFFASVQAQTSDYSAENPGPITKATSLASVGIQEPKIVSQDGNKFKISFDLVNFGKIQPDVKYYIELKGDSGATIDQKYFPEILTLEENQKISREIGYSAPDFLKGDYTLWIFASNSRSLILSSLIIGKTTLNGNDEYLFIPDCTLSVEEDQAENKFKGKYPSSFGVDVAFSEKLTANCVVINNFKKSGKFYPQFETYYRSASGQLLNIQKQSPVEFKVKDAQYLSLEIPKIEKPQSYDAVLSFVDEKGNVVSNRIPLHYVIQGFSGTIQNVTFDKASYAKGEQAKLFLYVTGSADIFYGSRGKGSQMDGMEMDISIVSGKKKCSEDFKKSLDGKIDAQEVSISVTQDCPSPEARVLLTSNKGDVLDLNVYNKNGAKDIGQPKKVSIFQKIAESWMFILIALIVLAPLVVLGSYFLKRKKEKENSFPPIAPMIFLIFGIYLCFFSQNVQAATSVSFNAAPYSPDWEPELITASIPSGSFYPGNTVTVSGTARSALCYNGDWGNTFTRVELIDGYGNVLDARGDFSFYTYYQWKTLTVSCSSPYYCGEGGYGCAEIGCSLNGSPVTCGSNSCLGGNCWEYGCEDICTHTCYRNTDGAEVGCKSNYCVANWEYYSPEYTGCYSPCTVQVQEGIRDFTFSAQFTAPSTTGTYTLRVYGWEYAAWGPKSYSDMTFTVSSNGACGTDNGQTVSSITSYCVANGTTNNGLAYNVADNGTYWSWNCYGMNYAGNADGSLTAASCYAYKACSDTTWTPDNGSRCYYETVNQTSNCGTARQVPGGTPLLNGSCDSNAKAKAWDEKPNGTLCSSGTASDPQMSGDSWTWTCSGVCGGAPASCTAARDKSWKEVQP